MLLAYIDPGSGLLLWQGIVAAFVGLLFYLRQTRKWIVRQFQRVFGRGPKAETVKQNPTLDRQRAE